ncbi:MAG: hypothetical protein U9Q81_15600 [Pseudomonadota bacterium]|nr:hypothetical protein [Pseudomonadota bacterium]
MTETRKELEACDFSDHTSGKRACPVCERGYPQLCRCGGLVHAEVVKVEGNGYLQITRCDRCGLPR